MLTALHDRTAVSRYCPLRKAVSALHHYCRWGCLVMGTLITRNGQPLFSSNALAAYEVTVRSQRWLFLLLIRAYTYWHWNAAGPCSSQIVCNLTLGGRPCRSSALRHLDGSILGEDQLCPPPTHPAPHLTFESLLHCSLRANVE